MRWAVKPQFMASLLDRLEGWWLDACLAHLATSVPISSEDLVDKIQDLSDQLRDDNLPIDDLDVLLADFGPSGEDDHRSRVFVAQLELIDVGEKRLLLAIRD